MGERPRIGLTLPTFVDDPEKLADVARAADAVDVIDGVFTYDHLFRIGSDGRRPALALEPVLGLLAVETNRIRFGPLVARATVRHAATLRSVFATVARIAPGRLIAGVGAGDWVSDPEQHMFGLPAGTRSVELGALEATVEALHGGGFPVWVGGRSDQILATAAALADGWNGWGLSPGAYSLEVRQLREACEVADRPVGSVTATWAGLVELRASHWPEARERADVLAGSFDQIAESLAHLADVGAEWVILAPVDPGDPENPAIVAEEIATRLEEA